MNDLKFKQQRIATSLDRCIELVESDPTRALQALDTARITMQEIWLVVWKKHHESGRSAWVKT